MGAGLLLNLIFIPTHSEWPLIVISDHLFCSNLFSSCLNFVFRRLHILKIHSFEAHVRNRSVRCRIAVLNFLLWQATTACLFFWFLNYRYLRIWALAIFIKRWWKWFVISNTGVMQWHSLSVVRRMDFGLLFLYMRSLWKYHSILIDTCVCSFSCTRSIRFHL